MISHNRYILTIPNMGYINRVFKYLFENLGQKVILPPPISKKTIDMGIKLGNELFCMPLKVNIGDMVQGINLGANAVVFTAGGIDPCRYGFYWVMQKKILEEYFKREIHFFIFHHQGMIASFQQIFKDLKLEISKSEFQSILIRAIKKINLLIETEELTNKIRPREVIKGQTTEAFNIAIELWDNASTDKEIKKVRKKIVHMYNDIKIDRFFNPLKIMLTGEIFEVIEPTSNLHIEEKLGNQGIEVIKGLDYNDLVSLRIPYNFKTYLKQIITLYNSHKDVKGVKKYTGEVLSQVGFGGYGLHTIYNGIQSIRNGCDGIIQISPFTCMPEIISKVILKKICAEHNISFLSLVLDEHTEEQGFSTRLEAFVDILKNIEIKKRGKWL